MAALVPGPLAPSGLSTVVLTSLVAVDSSAPVAWAQLCGTDSAPILVDDDRLAVVDARPAGWKLHPPAPKAANCGVTKNAPAEPAVEPNPTEPAPRGAVVPGRQNAPAKPNAAPKGAAPQGEQQ